MKRLPYREIYLEVSGACNARCPWCVTGNRSGGKGGLLSLGDFRRCIARLGDLGFVDRASGPVLHLYNWGEPTLNPQLNAMLEHLADAGLKAAISTNASRPLALSRTGMAALEGLVFSVSGITSASSSKIHGFKAEKVLRSIAETMRALRLGGWSGSASLAFHLYQFNLSEVSRAHDFCLSHGLQFRPSAAYFNDFHQMKAYLEQTLDRDTLIRASQQLLLYYVPARLRASPSDYCCPQFDKLALDEECNVLTCCVLPRGHSSYSLGSLFGLSREAILEQKRTQPVCSDCIARGQAYWVHHVEVPEFVASWTDGCTTHRGSGPVYLALRRFVPPFLRSFARGILR
jgi:MoaA/NifB/PqqE/SkfB family radical SAM enzyme